MRFDQLLMGTSLQVTGTGGGTSIRSGDKLFIAPSGVQKELMRPGDMFVMDFATRGYLRRPPVRFLFFSPIPFFLYGTVGHILQFSIGEMDD